MELKSRVSRFLATLGAIALLLSGCSSSPESEAPPAAVTASETTAEETSTPEASADETYIFTDSSGREVELPKNLERVASAGPLANILIYAVKPEVLVGWSSRPSESAKKYIDEKYWNLPEYGKFYDNQGDFNREALMSSDPQVIIDCGQWDEQFKKDVDDLSAQLGIPYVIIDGNLENSVEMWKMAGRLLGEEKLGNELADYTEKILTDAKKKAATIPEAERKTVFVAESEDGLSTILAGTIHAQTMEYVGANVVADPGSAEKQRGGGIVSMEQLLNWDPDVILFHPNSIYDTVGTNPSWEGLSAIQNDTYYEIPGSPHHWISRPPGPNRLVGINWVGNLLYPDVFDNDIVQETKDFYKLFYRYELTDDEVGELLGNSTLKNK